MSRHLHVISDHAGQSRGSFRKLVERAARKDRLAGRAGAGEELGGCRIGAVARCEWAADEVDQGVDSIVRPPREGGALSPAFSLNVERWALMWVKFHFGRLGQHLSNIMLLLMNHNLQCRTY